MLLCARTYCAFTHILLRKYLLSIKTHTKKANGTFSTLPQVPDIGNRENIVTNIDFAFQPTKETVIIIEIEVEPFNQKYKNIRDICSQILNRNIYDDACKIYLPLYYCIFLDTLFSIPEDTFSIGYQGKILLPPFMGPIVTIPLHIIDTTTTTSVSKGITNTTTTTATSSISSDNYRKPLNDTDSKVQFILESDDHSDEDEYQENGDTIATMDESDNHTKMMLQDCANSSTIITNSTNNTTTTTAAADISTNTTKRVNTRNALVDINATNHDYEEYSHSVSTTDDMDCSDTTCDSFETKQTTVMSVDDYSQYKEERGNFSDRCGINKEYQIDNEEMYNNAINLLSEDYETVAYQEREAYKVANTSYPLRFENFIISRVGNNKCILYIMNFLMYMFENVYRRKLPDFNTFLLYVFRRGPVNRFTLGNHDIFSDEEKFRLCRWFEIQLNTHTKEFEDEFIQIYRLVESIRFGDTSQFTPEYNPNVVLKAVHDVRPSLIEIDQKDQFLKLSGVGDLGYEFFNRPTTEFDAKRHNWRVHKIEFVPLEQYVRSKTPEDFVRVESLLWSVCDSTDFCKYIVVTIKDTDIPTFTENAFSVHTVMLDNGITDYKNYIHVIDESTFIMLREFLETFQYLTMASAMCSHTISSHSVLCTPLLFHFIMEQSLNTKFDTGIQTLHGNVRTTYAVSETHIPQVPYVPDKTSEYEYLSHIGVDNYNHSVSNGPNGIHNNTNPSCNRTKGQIPNRKINYSHHRRTQENAKNQVSIPAMNYAEIRSKAFYKIMCSFISTKERHSLFVPFIHSYMHVIATLLYADIPLAHDTPEIPVSKHMAESLKQCSAFKDSKKTSTPINGTFPSNGSSFHNTGTFKNSTTISSRTKKSPKHTSNGNDTGNNSILHRLESALFLNEPHYIECKFVIKQKQSNIVLEGLPRYLRDSILSSNPTIAQYYLDLLQESKSNSGRITSSKTDVLLKFMLSTEQLYECMKLVIDKARHNSLTHKSIEVKLFTSIKLVETKITIPQKYSSKPIQNIFHSYSMRDPGPPKDLTAVCFGNPSRLYGIPGIKTGSYHFNNDSIGQQQQQQQQKEQEHLKNSSIKIARVSIFTDILNNNNNTTNVEERDKMLPKTYGYRGCSSINPDIEVVEHVSVQSIYDTHCLQQLKILFKTLLHLEFSRTRKGKNALTFEKSAAFLNRSTVLRPEIPDVSQLLVHSSDNYTLNRIYGHEYLFILHNTTPKAGNKKTSSTALRNTRTNNTSTNFTVGDTVCKGIGIQPTTTNTTTTTTTIPILPNTTSVYGVIQHDNVSTVKIGLGQCEIQDMESRIRTSFDYLMRYGPSIMNVLVTHKLNNCLSYDDNADDTNDSASTSKRNNSCSNSNKYYSPADFKKILQRSVQLSSVSKTNKTLLPICGPLSDFDTFRMYDSRQISPCVSLEPLKCNMSLCEAFRSFCKVYGEQITIVALSRLNAGHDTRSNQKALFDEYARKYSADRIQYIKEADKKYKKVLLKQQQQQQQRKQQKQQDGTLEEMQTNSLNNSLALSSTNTTKTTDSYSTTSQNSSDEQSSKPTDYIDPAYLENGYDTIPPGITMESIDNLLKIPRIWIANANSVMSGSCIGDRIHLTPDQNIPLLTTSVFDEAGFYVNPPPPHSLP